MIPRKRLLIHLELSRSRDGARHERNADGLEGPWWQRVGGESRPEGMTIAAEGREPCDPGLTEASINFGPFKNSAAVIAIGDHSIPGPGPRPCDARRKILRVESVFQRTE